MVSTRKEEEIKNAKKALKQFNVRVELMSGCDYTLHYQGYKKLICVKPVPVDMVYDIICHEAVGLVSGKIKDDLDKLKESI